MKSIRKTIKLFRFNMSAILFFEMIYKIISLALLLPAIYSLLNYSVICAGVPYLTGVNITKYLKTPSTYCIIFVILMILSIYVLIDISALIYAMEASYREIKTNPIELLFKGTFNALRLINPKNMPVMLYVFFLLPFTDTVFISGSIAGIHIPEMFMRILKQHRQLVDYMVLAYAIISILAMMLVFSLNYYTLYKVKYTEAVKMSKNTVMKHRFKVIAGTLLWNIVITFSLFLLEGALASIIAGVLKNVIGYKELYFAFTNIVNITFWLMYLLFSFLGTPLIFAYICNEFYEIEGDSCYDKFKNAVKHKKDKEDAWITGKRKQIMTTGLVVLSLVLNGVYIYLLASNRVNLRIAYPTRASVTAHRGDSKHAPENTMAAIRLAVENQADIIEIDVRQTLDGEFIIMHDESLYRTTGSDKIVGTVTYDYIKQLDAGSWFSKEYEGERIPTLDAVLAYASENDVFLNIELKPALTDKNYEEGIMELIEKYDYIDKCYLASTDYDLLVNMKKINPDVKTLLIMYMVFGNIGDMSDVDAFSIRNNFVTKELVTNIHKQGKPIYSWTVNSKEKIKKQLLLDVDGIISDNPYNAKDIIYNANDSIITDWLHRLVIEY